MSSKGKLAKIVKAEVVDRRSLTLDEIEQKMIELATDDSNDIVQNMINERKMSMLEKIANLKLKRLQLKALEQSNVVNTVEPITVKFVSSKTQEQQSRLDRIDKEIIENRQIKQNA